jgi:NAD(P)-dependent dehydrogenase (short-subunit alcohol dehydrogenase family)
MKKAAVITGASSGIGAETAKLFSKNGYFVFLAGRNVDRLTEVALQCPAGSSLLKIDFEKPETLKKYADHVFGRADISLEVLVNNAGIYQNHDFLGGDSQLWARQFQVNLFGPLQWTQMLMPLLVKSGCGSIVNVSSTLGLRPGATSGAYSAAKAAMNSWTQSLAIEYGPQGVRVNAVCPGIVDTPIHAFHSLPEQEKEKRLNAMAKLQPMSRIGRPDEIAKAVYFLATEQSSWTTGALLSVDGGINLV